MEARARTARPERSAREQFDRQAEHYDEQWSRWTEASLRWLVEAAQPRPTDRALDVATGTGFTAAGLAPHVASVVGLDVSPGMLEQARQRCTRLGFANVAFREGTAEALPFEEGCFDLVTCRIAPHHFLDVRQFACEVARVLRPGGRLVVADTSAPEGDPVADAWQNETERLRDPSHVRNYTASEWREIVEGAGLIISHLSTGSDDMVIPLSDWLLKAGCTPPQCAALMDRFATAPGPIRSTFRIRPIPTGDTLFQWHRVSVVAGKA
ncbi:MAG TPA: methyltransferase domain-containing protein [Armatimonadota bacterium]|jgi:ubiquinone/menaquinone biosynthesis C-methylase UbiE